MNTISVLVVDDDMAICRIVRGMLAPEQYDVQTSQSVAETLEAIKQKLFDVYVLDYKLQDGSGLDVAERIRSQKSAAPIVLMSGYDSSAFALGAQKLRITHFLQKPFSSATISNIVRKAIDSAPATPAIESEIQDTKEPRQVGFVPRRLAEIKRLWQKDADKKSRPPGL